MDYLRRYLQPSSRKSGIWFWLVFGILFLLYASGDEIDPFIYDGEDTLILLNRNFTVPIANPIVLKGNIIFEGGENCINTTTARGYTLDIIFGLGSCIISFEASGPFKKAINTINSEVSKTLIIDDKSLSVDLNNTPVALGNCTEESMTKEYALLSFNITMINTDVNTCNPKIRFPNRRITLYTTTTTPIPTVNKESNNVEGKPTENPNIEDKTNEPAVYFTGSSGISTAPSTKANDDSAADCKTTIVSVILGIIIALLILALVGAFLVYFLVIKKKSTNVENENKKMKKKLTSVEKKFTAEKKKRINAEKQKDMLTVAGITMTKFTDKKKAEMKQAKVNWIDCIFKYDPSGNKMRRSFEEFEIEAYQKRKWSKYDTNIHPLYLKYFALDRMEKVFANSWDTVDTIPDIWAYEPKKPTGEDLKPWIKRAWIICLYLPDLNKLVAQREYDDFMEQCECFGWDKNEIEIHPLFLQHYSHQHGRLRVTRLPPNKWYTEDTIPDDLAYEPLKKEGLKVVDEENTRHLSVSSEQSSKS